MMMRGSFLVLVLASTLLILACDENIGGGFIVENRTETDLYFEVLIEEGWYRPVAEADAGETATVITASILNGRRCTPGPLVAYGPDGREVARYDAPVCFGDRWVIGDPMQLPSASPP